MGTETAKTSLSSNDKITLKISFDRLAFITVSFPSISLIICLVTAVLFRYDRVTGTLCNVTNSIPSVSAVIGVSPQRYVWRVGIALHAAPRFAIGLMYMRLYQKRIPLEEPKRAIYTILYKGVFVLYNIETACFILVSYISNVENYPIHEKLFVVYMISSVAYQLLTLTALRCAFPHMHLNKPLLNAYLRKRMCFVVMCASTSILLFAFFLHRVYCVPGAFSIFSLAEYFIFASCICFHYSAVEDFKNSHWSVEFVISDAIKSS